MDKGLLTGLLRCLWLLAMTAIFVGVSQATPVAAHLNGFSAGRIMDDAVMSDKSSMSEAQIQSFLKSKNHCNDRDYAKYLRNTAAGYSYNWKDGRFVCMADEVFNGESAAKIIWQAAQDYSINPQVLIVLLEKEQSLITDTWPNSRQYQIATGFGCPDTAPCDAQYYGLKNQVRRAAALFRDVLNGGWSNYPAYSTVYVRYSPDASCGGSNVFIENRATSALYRYTPYQPNAAALAAGTGSAKCGAYGNRNFYHFFTEWFGSTHAKMFECDAVAKDVVCVWRARNAENKTEFLSPDVAAVKDKISGGGWAYGGLAFYAYSKPRDNAVPVYALLLNGSRYFYTTGELEKKNVLATLPSQDLGVAFYVLDSTYRSNSGYPVYRQVLNDVHLYYMSGAERNELMNSTGYVSEGIGWYAPSGRAETRPVANGRVNVYRLFNGTRHFYTAGLAERDNAIRAGWKSEGVAFTTTAGTGTPVYRLFRNNVHIYVLSVAERDKLVSGGWRYEGVAWNVDDATTQVFEFHNGNSYFYTASVAEAFSIANRGWTYTGKRFGTSQEDRLAVYRFYSTQQNQHFYTVSVPEALAIVNRGWVYEGIGFYANKGTVGRPVYRFYLHNNHFYTANEAEKATLMGRGERYEGVAWYVGGTRGDTPVYRLVVGHQHFYTANVAERDVVIKNGGKYEGIAW